MGGLHGFNIYACKRWQNQSSDSMIKQLLCLFLIPTTFWNYDKNVCKYLLPFEVLENLLLINIYRKQSRALDSKYQTSKTKRFLNVTSHDSSIITKENCVLRKTSFT